MAMTRELIEKNAKARGFTLDDSVTNDRLGGLTGG